MSALGPRAPENLGDQAGGLDPLGMIVGPVRHETAMTHPERRRKDGRHAGRCATRGTPANQVVAWIAAPAVLVVGVY
mgnify:CR=1 FL=1